MFWLMYKYFGSTFSEIYIYASFSQGTTASRYLN